MPNKCIQMNLFHRGTSRAPITSQSLMHLLCWKEGSAAISVFRLGNGNAGRLSVFLKVTQNICSRTGEFQVSAYPGDHHSHLPVSRRCIWGRHLLLRFFLQLLIVDCRSLAWDTTPNSLQPAPVSSPGSSSLFTHRFLLKAPGISSGAPRGAG